MGVTSVHREVMPRLKRVVVTYTGDHGEVFEPAPNGWRLYVLHVGKLRPRAQAHGEAHCVAEMLARIFSEEK